MFFTSSSVVAKNLGSWRSRDLKLIIDMLSWYELLANFSLGSPHKIWEPIKWKMTAKKRHNSSYKRVKISRALLLPGLSSMWWWHGNNKVGERRLTISRSFCLILGRETLLFGIICAISKIEKKVVSWVETNNVTCKLRLSRVTILLFVYFYKKV